MAGRLRGTRLRTTAPMSVLAWRRFSRGRCYGNAWLGREALKVNLHPDPAKSGHWPSACMRRPWALRHPEGDSAANGRVIVHAPPVQEGLDGSRALDAH